MPCFGKKQTPKFFQEKSQKRLAFSKAVGYDIEALALKQKECQNI